MPTIPARARLIKQIAQLPGQIQELTQNLSSDQLLARPLADEWSVAQNVHHLADSHMNSYIRCKLIATEDHPPLKPYDQDIWAGMDDAKMADLAPSLAILTGLHARWVIFWQSLAEADWQRTGHHPEIGSVTLDDQLVSYAAHGLAHIEQIKRTLAVDEA